MGRMEFDGSVRYKVQLEGAGQPTELSTIRLCCSMPAKQMLLATGLQLESVSLAPDEPIDSIAWRWNVEQKNQDSVWLGAVNAGLRVQLKAENYIRPSVNIHYKRRPLNNPPSCCG